MKSTTQRTAGAVAIAAILGLLALPLRQRALRNLLATGIALPAPGRLGPLLWVLTPQHEAFRVLFANLYGIGVTCVSVSLDGHAVLIFGTAVQAEQAQFEGHNSPDGGAAAILNSCLGDRAVVSISLVVAGALSTN